MGSLCPAGNLSQASRPPQGNLCFIITNISANRKTISKFTWIIFPAQNTAAGT